MMVANQMAMPGDEESEEFYAFTAMGCGYQPDSIDAFLKVQQV